MHIPARRCPLTNTNNDLPINFDAAGKADISISPSANLQFTESAGRGSLISSVVISVIFAVSWAAYSIITPSSRYLPTVDNVALLFIDIAFANQIRNPYARYAFLGWSLWFVLGSISLFAQNHLSRGLNYNVDASTANRLYLLCVFAGVFGAFLIQVLTPNSNRRRPASPSRGQNQIIWTGVLLFPLIYAVSIIFSTGDVPLFSGRDVSAEMYEVDYGRLHDFGILNVISCSMLWMKTNDRSSIWSQSFYKTLAIALLAVFLVCAALDGKRVMSIFAVAALMLYYVALPSTLTRWIWISLMALAGLFAYVSAATLRAGRDFGSAFDDIYAPLATVGTEYRDYVYGFTMFTRQHMLSTGYDWAGSTLAVITPSFLARAFGIDKDTIIIHDSARSLMPLWNVRLGIRIGLPGELWFAYGWLAPAFFIIFGAMLMVVANAAARSQHFFYKSVLITVVAIWTLAMQGQSTVTFGLLLPMIYLALGVFLIDLILRKFVGAAYNR